MPKKKPTPAKVLKGWAAIAKFMGTTSASAQTWAKQGMPVKCEGRFTVADPAEVQAWLGQQSHMPKPAHIPCELFMGKLLKEMVGDHGLEPWTSCL